MVINGRATVRAQIGGVERFARELSLRLVALRPDRYRVIRPPAALAHRAGHAWEQGVLPLQGRSARLILSPANLAPVLSTRNAVVIHDAAALRHPEAYGNAYVAYQRRILPAIAAHAELLFTVSEFARAELVELLRVRPERIIVIPEGVDSRFSPDAGSEGARRRYGLSAPYVLALGTVSDRKNLGVLEEAGHALKERGIELVLAGSDRGYLRGEGTLPARRLGYVADDDLPAVYVGALAFVMPSRYEGFGLPCLEAMASGVPVVAANAGALPETVGDAALLIDPADHHGFTEALLSATSDDQLRATLAAKGTARAHEFHWDRTASRTDAAIAALLDAS